ncbi:MULTISPECIES: AMP-dependent synthetase/ligase [Myroides]|uniref:AMP-dependent synthetase/ligase n=1 Tax=Myroides TaxID=76831 RepID=UPI0013235DDA|nr:MULTISPECIES: AMP-dependent synthetase/ligase [Myroides]MVX36883.1 AMP-binding protein [Myroides sp. LoEW2-1]UVD79523.1 AMP-dependent synthetase/ligase [Myroides albus]
MIDPTRLFDIPYLQRDHFPLSDALVTKVNGEWVKTSSEEYVNKANAISRALLRLGIKENDKIAVITNRNHTNWNILDIGILQIGAQNVPIYPTISAEDYQYILSHSEAKYCVVSDIEVYEKLISVKDQLPLIIDICSFDQIDGCKNFDQLLALGEDKSNQAEVDRIKDTITPDHLATLIYTSGTTGKPKGVMLSHNNILSNALGSADRIPFTRDEKYRSLSFLPICHVFERMLIYLYQFNGVAIYYAESIDKMGDNLKEVKPNVMTVVPRLLEKVYDKIFTTGSALTGLKKRIFFWALELGFKYQPYDRGFFYNLQLGFARKLVFKKWVEALGGNIKLIVSGSAALQPRLARVFNAAGIVVVEGYGLTETSPVIAVNDKRNRGMRAGTVGKPISNVEVKIAEDGEILCKGPNVMLGYYKDEEKTKSVIKDGYFHTEDIGKIDEDGFLHITDRKKEMFKTSGGKYVAPQMIENTMKHSRFIEQIMVIGEGEKMPAAFIQPNFEFIREWARRKRINIGTTDEELVKNEKVIERIAKEIDHINKKFGKWEQVKKFELTPEVWSIDSEHLTPTLKLRRKIILAKYHDLYEKIYRG